MERTTYLPDEVGWHNWRDLFTQTAVFTPLILHICQEMGVEMQNIRAGYPGSCAVFVVNEQQVVKLYPPIFATDFDREIAVYQLIGKNHFPHIPQLLASGIYPDQIDWPYLVLSFCAGEPIRELYSLLTAVDKQAIGTELGGMIRQLHILPAAFPADWATWAAFLQANRDRTLAYLHEQRPLPINVINEIEQFLQVREAEWLTERPLCLINADLTEDHLLLEKGRNGRYHISGLIDWADAEMGVPNYEWIPLYYSLCQRDPVLFQSIMQAYDSAWQWDESIRNQLLLYTFLHRFGGEIVAHELARSGKPPISSLAQLTALFCPSSNDA